MANAASAGEFRPKSARITQPIHYADGTVGTITWVKEPTVIKRIRRALSARNHRLVITREGSQARRELGMYSVLDADDEVLQHDADLTSLARFLDVLAADEHIEPPPLKNWLFYVARYERVVVDGIEANYAAPITRMFSTAAAARRAVDHLKDRDGLVICSFDTTARARTAAMREARHV